MNLTVSALAIFVLVHFCSAQSAIHFWYGSSQKVVSGGCLDDWYLLGNVDDPGSIASLTCALNGSAPKSLTFNSTMYRLSKRGNFVADYPVNVMNAGINTFVVTATGTNGEVTTAQAEVDFQPGAFARTLNINWPAVSSIQDVAMIGDGKWRISSEGLHIVEPGYDRVVFIGNNTWRDYEVTARMKVHRYSGIGYMGFVMRFKCHYANTADQPKWGYLPLGALCWFGTKNAAPNTVRPQFAHGVISGEENFEELSLSPGQWVWIKARCETLHDDALNNTTRYSFKTWPDGSPEPQEWYYERSVTDIRNGAVRGLRAGSLGLIAHMAEVTFSTTSIRPVGVDSAESTIRISQARNGRHNNRICSIVSTGLVRIAPPEPRDISVYLMGLDGRVIGTLFQGHVSAPVLVALNSAVGIRPQGLYVLRVAAQHIREDLLIGPIR